MNFKQEPSSESSEHIREKTLDKTIADSFPTSDPPSSIPDPVAAHTPASSKSVLDELIANLPPGSWAAISEQEHRVVGTGATREEAIQSAGSDSMNQLQIVRVPQDPDAPEQAA